MDLITADRPGFTAIIVSHLSSADLEKNLPSVIGQPDVRQVIVVENGATQRTEALVKAISSSKLRYYHLTENAGFGAAVNAVVEAATSSHLLILNPDVLLRADTCRHIWEEFEAGVGIVGPVVLQSQSHTADFGATLDLLLWPGGLKDPQAKPLFVQGCALAIPKRLFTSLGGFDNRYFLFAEDVEICWRALRSGMDVRVARGAYVDHVGGASASGGYPTDAGITTTPLRVRLRDRNTLTCVVACAPLPVMPLLVVLALAKTITTSACLVACGHRKLALDVLRGLLWNAWNLPKTLSRRRNLPIYGRPIPSVRRLHFGIHLASEIRHLRSRAYQIKP